MTVDISPEHVVSDDSRFVDVVHLAEKYSWPYNVIGHVYVTSPPDFRNYTNRKMMVDFLTELENTKYFTTTSSTGQIFWMKDFLKYLNFVNNGNQGNAEILDDMIIDNDFIADFYTQLESFLSLTENAKFIGDIHFKSLVVSTGDPDIESFQMIAFFQQVTTWDDHIKLLHHWRNACSQFPQLGALVADHSSLNPYLDQRVTLSPTLLQTMGIALLSMTLVTGIFMPDIIGIFYITLSFISVDIGVIGFLEVWQCSLEPATMTGILMTNGFSVYYTARVCYNYQCTDKTMDAKEKVIETMALVGWPILQGGIGTIIGIAPLAFMKTYTTRTFFKTIILVVLAGLLHGLLFMPIIMSSLDNSGKKHASVEKRRPSTKAFTES
uniref:Patched family protein n=1 Tax=Romanomermis culicivorax TaxID=13658 RepID=A0A915IJV5_ROMCU